MIQTREEAKIQIELLKLATARIRKEMDAIRNQFCNKNDHYWCKRWVESKERPELFKVTHIFCCLCGVWKILKINGFSCPICYEGVIYDMIEGEEDVAACPYCGYNNTMDPCGVPRRNIPAEDSY